MRRLRTGDQIRLRNRPADGWTEATVILASPNGRSVGIEIHQPLRSGTGLYAGGAVPLIIDYGQQTVSDLMGEQYQVEVVSRVEST